MASVTIVGSFNVDHVWHCDTLPAPGATLAGRYASGPGGKGFNQAIAAVRAGAQAVFVCALGRDAGGELARGLARADGLDLRALDSTEPTGTAGIYVDARGRNCIVIGAEANAALDAAFVTRNQDAIRASGVVLAQLESPPDAIIEAFRLGRDGNARTLLNPAPANAVSSTELLALADAITPNETEFAALLARHVGERIDANDVAAMEGARLHAACRQLLPHGSVIITLGSAGVFVSHAENALHGDAKPHYRIAAESVDAIDTTGAGDAFSGALAASWAQAPDTAFGEHLRFANRFAALSTEHRGAALSMPCLSELEDRYGSH